MEERAIVVGLVREVAPGQGYVALERHYVVAGTTDERRGTVFLRFRKPGAEWLLTELRSAP